MVKALQRITETEFKSKTGSGGRASKTTPTTIPNKEMIESIAEKSNGDIRFAVNMLQFSCFRGVVCVAMVTILLTQQVINVKVLIIAEKWVRSRGWGLLSRAESKDVILQCFYLELLEKYFTAKVSLFYF